MRSACAPSRLIIISDASLPHAPSSAHAYRTSVPLIQRLATVHPTRASSFYQPIENRVSASCASCVHPTRARASASPSKTEHRKQSVCILDASWKTLCRNFGRFSGCAVPARTCATSFRPTCIFLIHELLDFVMCHVGPTSPGSDAQGLADLLFLLEETARSQRDNVVSFSDLRVLGTVGRDDG